MDVKKNIKSLLNQADVYRSQGLLREAGDKYAEAGKLIQKHHRLISNHKSLLSAISKKIRQIRSEIRRLDSDPAPREMSEQVQNIIKEKFAFSRDKNTARLEGAVALAKFGQYEKALEELRTLVLKEPTRLEAAKNIIRCHVALGALREATKQYQQWFSGDFFTPDQLSKLRALLQGILDKSGSEIRLPSAEDDKHELSEFIDEKSEGPEIGEEDLLDISSVSITIGEDDDRQTHEYDVSFQSDNVINLLISDRDRDFLAAMEPDTVLEPVTFYSPIAMFEGKAVVVSKSQIESGPKKGHYSLDIKIKSL